MQKTQKTTRLSLSWCLQRSESKAPGAGKQIQCQLPGKTFPQITRITTGFGLINIVSYGLIMFNQV
jgi:hypothetical protein